MDAKTLETEAYQIQEEGLALCRARSTDAAAWDALNARCAANLTAIYALARTGNQVAQTLHREHSTNSHSLALYRAKAAK